MDTARALNRLAHTLRKLADKRILKGTTFNGLCERQVQYICTVSCTNIRGRHSSPRKRVKQWSEVENGLSHVAFVYNASLLTTAAVTLALNLSWSLSP